MTSSFQCVHSRFAQGFKDLLPKVALGSLLAVAGFASVPNAAQAFIPAYTTTDSVKGFQPATSSTNPGSFGFFFDTNKDIIIDGLGFSSQSTWGSSTSYDVKLWEYRNNGDDPSDYSLIASKTFIHGIPYDFTDGYFWQSIDSPLTLKNSIASIPSILQGYVIGVIGDFSDNPGNVAAEGGVASFLKGIVNNDSGDNFSPDVFFPVPVYRNLSTNTTAYFNGNLSYDPDQPSTVPGPLPLLGAVAGFSFSRRLRKRIQATR
jgi:hypothetical protein